MRVDCEAGVLARKTLLGLRQAEPLPHDVHQVGGIGAVENVEARIEAESLAVQADQAIADRVKRPGPGQTQRRRQGSTRPAARTVEATACCARRVISSAARRVNVRSSTRSAGNAREKQVRHAVRQGARLAGASAGDDEQRPGRHPAPGFHLAVPDRLALGRI